MDPKLRIGPIVATGLGVASWGAATAFGATAVNQGPAVAAADARPHIQHQAAIMSEPVTRAELDARFKVVEVVAAAARKEAETGLQQVLTAIAAIGKELTDFKTDSKAAVVALAADVKTDYQNTRSTINNFAIGALAIALTVVLAIGVLVWSAQGNMATQNGNVLSAFGAGKEASDAIAEAREAATPPPLYDAQTGKKLAAR